MFDMNLKIKTDFLLILLVIVIVIVIISNCTTKNNNKNLPAMPEQQKELLLQHKQKGIDVGEVLKEANLTPVNQHGKIRDFKLNTYINDTLKLRHPNPITMCRSVETENYFYLNNIIQSPTHNNIAQFYKNGKYIKSFGRKGRGPGEKTSIGVIAEQNDTTYLFDNGYLKLFDKELKEINRIFLGLWANQVYLNDHTIDLKIAANKYFPFPVTLIDKKKYEITLSIIDARPDILKTTTTSDNTFFSNDNYLFYAKTTLDLLHVLNKKNNTFSHFKLSSDFIRENKKSLEENATPDEYVAFFKNLFVIERLHYVNNNLWVLFRDGTGENMKRYLGKVSNLFTGNQRKFVMYDLNTVANYDFGFYKDHLNLSYENENKTETILYQIKLNRI